MTKPATRYLEGEIHKFRQMNGKNPKGICFHGLDLVNKLRIENSDFMFLDAKEKIPNDSFMGIPLFFMRESHGGSFDWGFLA